MTTPNLIATTTALFFVLLSPSFAAEELAQFDVNGDASLDSGEFSASVLPVFEHLGVPGDELTVADMHRLVFQLWDKDMNASISQQEFIRPENWDSGIEALDFSRADIDDNASLDEVEFLSFNEPDMYSSWDADGNGGISKTELATSLFALLDADRDSILSAEEYAVMADVN